MPSGYSQFRWFRALSLPLGIGVLLTEAGGCISGYAPGYLPPELTQQPVAVINNPALVPVVDRDLLWNSLVDVVDDYFKIEREERVKLVGDLLTEGRIDTAPRGGSTIFEPWNRDSVTQYERLESTLQSIRRRATIRAIPTEGGYLIDVAVFKELEDIPRPETGIASRAANLRNDNALQRATNPVGGQQPTLGWISMGRDVALEQEILLQLQARTAAFTAPRVAR